MRNYPKALNTRTDYEYVRRHFNKDLWKKDFETLLETQYDWFFDRVLSDDETEESGFFQKVITDPQTGERTLYVWKENPNCKLLQLGYTAEEVTEILNA